MTLSMILIKNNSFSSGFWAPFVYCRILALKKKNEKMNEDIDAERLGFHFGNIELDEAD